MTQGFFKVF